ncbi:MAG: DNA primase [Finegoldia sp.]|nr:DNA primase [Finegoldia sp.]
MAYIPEEKIEEIKESVDIVSVISDYVDLKKRGQNYIGLCPFHNEKTPSFTVSQNKKIFHCFGCGVGGDVISFIMKIEGMSYIEAIKYLADKQGIFLETGEIDKEKYAHRKKLLKINEEAKFFYYKNLLVNDRAKRFIKDRQLNSQMINKFMIGYADDKNSLGKYLIKMGYNEEDLVELGLVNKDRLGNIYDKFRNRVMFPIEDTRGATIAFGGRTLVNDKAKYMNSPQSIAYDKSKNIYGVNNLRNSQKKGKILLVEGYMDVISLTNYGFDYAVASLGTSLTEEQAKLISRYCKNIYICYDGDSAGQMATQRAIDIFKEVDIVPYIVTIPDNKDPDDYVKAYGKEAFERLLVDALDPVMFNYKKLSSKFNLNDISSRLEFIDSLSAMLAKIDRDVIRDEYIKKFSRELDIDYKSLRKDVEAKIANKVSPKIDTSRVEVKNTDTSYQERKLAMDIMILATHYIDRFKAIKDEVDKFNTDIYEYNNYIKFLSDYYDTNKGKTIDEETVRDNFKNEINMYNTIDYIFNDSKSKLDVNKIDLIALDLRAFNLNREKEKIKKEIDLLKSTDLKNEMDDKYQELLHEIFELNKELKAITIERRSL